MNILFLTQWFQPEPIFKGLPFAKELQRRGYRVEVLTGFPNYPGGKIYPGYRLQFRQSETLDGIPVHRTWLYPSHDRSVIRRVANYVSFSRSARWFGARRVSPPDIVYAYNLVTLAPAFGWLRRRYGCKVVLDVQDLWPESVLRSGMLKRLGVSGLLQRWSDAAYRSADRIVCLSPGMKANLTARGIPADRIEVIYNWADSVVAQAPRDPEVERELGLPAGFRVMFAGTMGVMQGMDTVLEAAKRTLAADAIIQWVLVGGGTEVERLQTRVRDEQIANVTFVGRQPMERMANIFACADALLVHLKADPLFEITIPSKTQAYLAAGKPVLMAVPGDAAALVEQARAGWTCPSSDPEALAQAAMRLAATPEIERLQMGERGREFYERELSMTVGVARFEALFAELAGTKLPSSRESA